MKILFITNQFNPPRSSGSGNSSSLIYKELEKRGNDIELLILDSPSFKNDYKETQYYKYYTERTTLTPIEEFSKIEDGKYDIIHQYGSGSFKYKLPMICGNFKQTKLVTTFNGLSSVCWNIIGQHRNKKNCCTFPKNIRCAFIAARKKYKLTSPLLYFYQKIRRFYNKRYDKYFALSKSLKVLLSKAGYNKSKISIIPNFFDPKLYIQLQNFDGEKSQKLVILYVGTLKKRKGVSNLIKAFMNINNKGIELRIVGDGPQKEKLIKIAEGDNKIEFLGKIPYKSEKFVKNYVEADIFVHPGIWPEPFGRTILEAAISKNAIIVSNIGAPPNVIGDKGLTYEPNDIQGLKKRLVDLIVNSEKRNKLAEEAYKYIIEEYSVENSIDKLEREYENLLND